MEYKFSMQEHYELVFGISLPQTRDAPSVLAIAPGPEAQSIPCQGATNSAEEESTIPRVTISRARLDGGWLDDGSLVKTGPLECFEKYSLLEETVLTLFGYDREQYELHFHLESHDRCVVRLRPLTWNNRGYFRTELMDEGSLRIIPHFLTAMSRSDRTKRPPETAFNPASITMVNPSPQKKLKLPPQQPSESMAAARVEDVDMEEIDETDGVIDWADRDTAHSPVPQRMRGNYRGALFFDPSSFNPQSTSSLPADATYKNWRQDYEQAKDRFIASQKPGMISHGVPRSKAHAEMIRGKYGMTASKPCSFCVAAGETCRVYHAACYDWTPPDIWRSIAHDLGWRCERCRLNVHVGGCNAQFNE